MVFRYLFADRYGTLPMVRFFCEMMEMTSWIFNISLRMRVSFESQISPYSDIYFFMLTSIRIYIIPKLIQPNRFSNGPRFTRSAKTVWMQMRHDKPNRDSSCNICGSHLCPRPRKTCSLCPPVCLIWLIYSLHSYKAYIYLIIYSLANVSSSWHNL